LGSAELQAKVERVSPLCLTEYGFRSARVTERNALKKAAQDAKLERRRGPKMDVERLLLKGATPFYETVDRTLVHSALSPGCTAVALKKRLDAALQRGQEFVHGSTADMVLRTSASHALSKAVQMWRSEHLSIQAKAHEQIETFMTTVTREHVRDLPWALEVCKAIFDASRALPQAPPPERLQSKKPDEETETEGDSMEVAAAELKKSWETKEFSLTMSRVASGEVKLTVWAVSQQFRQAYDKRRERLRKAYGISDAAAGSLHADISNQVLGQQSLDGGGQRTRGEQIAQDAIDRGERQLPQFQDTFKDARKG